MLKDIFNIHEYPSLLPDDTFSAKVLRVLKIYGLLFLVLIPVSLLLFAVNKYVTDVLHHQSLFEVNKRRFTQMFKYFGKPVAALIICVIGPIFEELIFRLWLNFKKRHIVMSALIATFYLAISMSGKFAPANQIWVVVQIEFILLLIALVVARYLVSNDEAKIDEDAKHGWISLSMIVFALMHISNYRPLDMPIFWIYPILVIPQLLIGWGITYLRFKNGFGWGVAMHILFNSASIAFALLTKQY